MRFSMLSQEHFLWARRLQHLLSALAQHFLFRLRGFQDDKYLDACCQLVLPRKQTATWFSIVESIIGAQLARLSLQCNHGFIFSSDMHCSASQVFKSGTLASLVWQCKVLSADFQRISLDQNGHMKCTNKNAKEIADMVKISSIAHRLREDKSLTCLLLKRRVHLISIFHMLYTDMRVAVGTWKIYWTSTSYQLSWIPLKIKNYL